jgi:hypothetical protein
MKKIKAFNPETGKVDLEVKIPDGRPSEYVCKSCGDVVGGCFEKYVDVGHMESRLQYICCPRCGLSGSENIKIRHY